MKVKVVPPVREKQMTTGMVRRVAHQKTAKKKFHLCNRRRAELSWNLFYVILRAFKSMHGVEEADESGLCHEEKVLVYFRFLPCGTYFSYLLI